jgi:hypothetical protein
MVNSTLTPEYVIYIGECKEILELDYNVTKVPMLLCSWVQPNMCSVHASTKVDEFGLTLVNFRKLLLIQEQPFVFPSQVDQMFFSNFTQEPSWKVVVSKGIQSRMCFGKIWLMST